MSDEQDKLKLSLEPPKLFGRKKKSVDRSAAPPQPAVESPAEPVVEEPVAEEPAPADEPVAEEPVAEPAPADEPVAEPAPADEPVVEAPEPANEELAAVIEDVQAAEAQPVAPAPTPAPEQTAVLDPVREPVVERAPLEEIEREDAEIAVLAQRNGVPLDLYPAAALTGLVVGAAMVVLIWLSLRGCEAVRGTASCGGGPGFLLLIAIFALTVLLGSALLKTLTVPDPGSSSFLAVGLVAVVALLFLIDFLDSWTMLIVVPLLSVGAFLASVWVTKTFVEPGEQAT